MIEVVPHDAAWSAAFADECVRLTAVMAHPEVRIEHMGSTSVPGLAAKPVIDILVGVLSLELVDSRTVGLVGLGYEAKGEYGLPGRRYFRKSALDGQRTHHLHAYLTTSPDFRRHLVFRDYLRSHPDRAAEYGALKVQIAGEGVAQRSDYSAAEADFVAALERDALSWAAKSREPR